MKQWSSEGFYLVSVAEARGWEKGSPLIAEVRAGVSQLHPFDIWGRIILCWEEGMFVYSAEYFVASMTFTTRCYYYCPLPTPFSVVTTGNVSRCCHMSPWGAKPSSVENHRVGRSQITLYMPF